MRLHLALPTLAKDSRQVHQPPSQTVAARTGQLAARVFGHIHSAVDFENMPARLQSPPPPPPPSPLLLFFLGVGFFGFTNGVCVCCVPACVCTRVF